MKPTPHPGRMLRELVRGYGLTQLAFARHVELSPHTIHEVISGLRPVSCLIAVRLENATGISANYWMHSQAMYELSQHRRYNENPVNVRKLKPPSMKFDGYPRCFDRCACNHWGWEHKDYPDGPCLDERCACPKYKRLGDVVKKITQQIDREREQTE